jgi:hypothetical protein
MVYNEKEKIDSKFDDVAEILPGKENVHIKARVIRLWKLPAFINLCESNLLELVLIDEKVSYFYCAVMFCSFLLFLLSHSFVWKGLSIL